MEKIKKQLNSSTAKSPYASTMRNFIASSIDFTVRQTEWRKSDHEYVFGIELFRRGRERNGYEKPLFRVERVGFKHVIMESCYKELFQWFGEQESNDFKVQGDEDAIIQEKHEASKQENVIITGPEISTSIEQTDVVEQKLMPWSNTEKYYDFSGGLGSIMNRWFPLDTVKITTSYTPSYNGGLVKSWKIPEDLIKNDFDSINVLPMRGFVLGHLDLEFKLILQANPFQACCVMLSTMPNPYGVYPKVLNWAGLKNDGSVGANLKTWPYSFESTSSFTYADREVAVQRPNCIIDVRTGGESTLRVQQKYHKTLVRNFDASFADNLNPGIRGAWTSNLLLHVLTQLRIGTGSDADFNVRVFYRFVEAKLTAMTETVSKGETKILTLPMFELKNADKVAQVSKIEELSAYRVQGGVLGTARAVTNIADEALNAVEGIGVGNRKGFKGILNRDKPNDPVTNVRAIPRPRTCFPNGVGVDDAVVMAMGWDELVEFFESFSDEPKSFSDFVRIKGILADFTWSKNQKAGDELFSWTVHPTIGSSSTFTDMAGNKLRAPLSIASSAFTNYWGTIELCIQFVKTDFHKGSVQVSIQFGRKVGGDALRSTYVKVLNVQDCSAFSVTIPYIYDTPVRTIAGTSLPIYLPSLANQHYMKFNNSTTVTIKVLNELTAPISVTNAIDAIVWVKGGGDFNLNFPRAVNTATFVNSDTHKLLLGSSNVREVMKSNKPDPQYAYNINNATVIQLPGTNVSYRVQGFDDDFNQGKLQENRITTRSHVGFSDLLKMPIKILKDMKVEPNITRKYISGGKEEQYTLKQYFSLPVAPLSYSLIDFLNHEWYCDKSTVNTSATAFFGNVTLQQSVQAQINSMFGMFRGSLVYTVVITSSTKPIFYAYLPHDYNLRPLKGAINVIQPVFGSGNYYATTREGLIGMADDRYVDLAACTTFNSMMVPEINSTERIVIPMSTQCNWLLMNRQIATESKKSVLQTLRENQEWFNGHLVMWSSDEFVMDVYLNNGDDHVVGGFLGHHGICNPWANFALNDNWRTQGLDFNFKELASKGWNSLKSLSYYAVSGAVSTCSMSVVPEELKPITLGIMTFCVLGGCNEIIKLQAVCQQTRDNVERIEERISNDDLMEHATGVIVNVIKETFPMMSIPENLTQKLWCAAQHFVHAALATNWKNTSFAVFCVLVKLDILEMPDWQIVNGRLTELFERILGRNDYTVQSLEEDTSHWQSVCELFVTILGAKMQVKASGGPREYLREMFQYQNYKNVNGLNAVMNLFRSLMKAINKIFNWLLEKKDPNVVLLQSLHKQGSEIATFVEEAGSYLNHFNDKDMRKKLMRVKYLHVVIQAYKLKQVLIQIGNPRVSQHLLSLCNDVIKKAIRQRYLFQCDIVKSEPFVLCIEGDSNLGKSFSVYDLSVMGLQSINYRTNNPDCLYTIPAGVDYWNAYDDQPVIWYDDWCNIMDDDTVKQHISQLYALKTSAAFNVPRAELDNKEQMANPEIIMMTTNNPFPKHPMIQFPEAVYRRRDLLVKFSLADGKESIKEFSEQQLANYEHLRVQIYADPTKPCSLSDTKYTYDQFKEIYVDKLKLFHEKELRNKNAKYKKLMSVVTESPLDVVDIGNPFEAFERVNEEELMNKPTAEIIEREVFMLRELIEKHLNLLKVKVGDEEIFSAQGLEADPEGDQENLMLRITTLPREVNADVREGFMALIMRWYKRLKAEAMVCERCGLDASSQGTAFWCVEHSHYLCFHCGTISARPYGIEKDSKEVFLDTYCCLHGTNVIVRHSGVFKNFFATMINVVLYKPLFIVNLWINRNNLEGDRALIASIFCLKLVIMRLVYAVSNCRMAYAVQGNEVESPDFILEDLESFFTGEVTPSVYDPTDLWEVTDKFTIKTQELFLEHNDDIAMGSKYTLNYVCPHTLLFKEYIYNDNKFHVDFGTEEILVLEDKLCKGRCVLTNQKFLNLVKEKMLVSKKLLEQFRANKIDVIRNRFPRFTHTVEIQKAMNRQRWVDKIIRKDWWENYVCPSVGKAWQFIRRMLPIVAACGAVWAATKGFERIWRWLSKLVGIEVQGHKYHGEQTKSPRARRNKRGFNPYATQAISENFENKLNKISHNFIIISVNGKIISAWGIKNTTFLVSKHQGRYIRNSRMFQISFVNDVTRCLDVVTSSCTFYEFEEKDLMQVTLNASAPLFRDCSAFIPSKRNQDLNHTRGTMLVLDAKTKNLYDQEVHILNVTHNFVALEGETEYRTRTVVMYDLQEKGMCGSLLCVDSNTPIVAMHIAGSTNTGRGVGVPLIFEEFSVQGDVVELEDSGDPTKFYGEDCLIDYVAAIPKNMVPYVPKKTAIQPSLVAKYLDPPVTRPAFLYKDEGYVHEQGPLFYGVRKNGFPPLEFSDCMVRRAFQHVSNLCLAGNLIRKPTILTVEQAVCGFPSMYVDDPYMDDSEEEIYYGPIPISTSAGFPYTTALIKERYGIKSNTKEEWLNVKYDDTYPVGCDIHPFVLENHNKNMELRQRGIMAENIFQDCLKDERRPIEKAMKEGGTRLFSMSNIEGTIALRRYTLDLTSFLRFNRIKNGIAVGINPESMEWTILAQTLLRHPNVFTTDFSNFGAGLSYTCGMQFASLIVEFYNRFGERLTNSHRVIVRTLIRELMASRHVVGNLIYGTFCGSPSGAAITVEINSFVHLMYSTIVWCIISDTFKSLAGVDPIYYRDLHVEYEELKEYFHEKGLNFKKYAQAMTLEEFEANVVKVVYGDDGIFSVSDEYREIYNAYTFNLVMKVHRIGVTDASKQAEICPYASLEAATFLKRHFVPHELLPNSLYMARMNLDSIYECAKWIHKNPLGPEICTYENCLSSLMLAFGHGEKFYETYREKLNSCLRKENLKQISLSWMDLCCKFYPTLNPVSL